MCITSNISYWELYLQAHSQPKTELPDDVIRMTYVTYKKDAFGDTDFLHGKISKCDSSSSRMRVIYHNWSATKQRPHPQSVAEISCHSVLSGDRIRQCETSSGSRHKDTDQCL